MNTDEVTHILQHLLAISLARFLLVFASDKVLPRNSIQSLDPGCYVSNSAPPGEGRSNCVAFFDTRPNRFKFLDSFGREHCEFGLSFQNSRQIFHNPY